MAINKIYTLTSCKNCAIYYTVYINITNHATCDVVFQYFYQHGTCCLYCCYYAELTGGMPVRNQLHISLLSSPVSYLVGEPRHGEKHPKQGLSRDSETECPTLTFVNILVVLFSKGDHNLLKITTLNMCSSHLSAT